MRPVAAQGPTVKIGSAVLGDYSMVAPILVALEKGFFRAQGVTAEFQPLRGGPDLVKAVVAGQLQIGASGATDVPVFRATGAPIRFIASQVDGNHFTLNVAPAITKLADLKGKSIGVTRVGATTWVFAMMLAKQQGWVPEKDITVVGLGGLDAQLAALSPRRDRGVHLGGRRGGDRAPGQVEDPAPARHRHAEVDQPGVLRDRRATSRATRTRSSGR